MSYSLYKVLHVAAVLFVFTALGGLLVDALRGGGDKASRKLPGLTHGIALLAVLITGFGLIARLGLGFPLWIWLKIVVWLAIGASIAAIRRLPQHARTLWLALPLLGAVAAYLAIYKPS